MTFLTELARLNVAIRSESDAFTRFGLIQQRDALLANRAGAIEALVLAAEFALEQATELREAFRTGAISCHDGKTPQRSNRNVTVEIVLREGLANLNKDSRP